MYRFLFLAVPIAAFIAGCGTSPFQLNGLNVDQKSQLTRTLEAVGRTQEAAFEAQKTSPTPTSSLAVTTPETSKQMASRLLLGNCRITTPNRPQVGNGQYQILVSGAGCPVAMTFVVNHDFSPTNYQGNMDINYRVIDEEFKRLNDIVAIEMKGSWESKFDATVRRANGSADIRGSFTSRELGVLQVSVSGTRTGDDKRLESTTLISMRFPTFTAELKKLVTGTIEAPKEEYFLNQQSITKDEFNTYINKSGNVFPVAGSR